jgi:hypothetical protein
MIKDGGGCGEHSGGIDYGGGERHARLIKLRLQRLTLSKSITLQPRGQPAATATGSRLSSLY